MKKTMLMLIGCLLCVFALTGCMKDGKIDASPSPTLKPSAMPQLSPSLLPQLSPSASPAGGILEGFSEGKEVMISAIPEIEQAIKKAFPEAVIKSVNFATYMSQQVYKVLLSGLGDGTNEIYVNSLGEILSSPGTSPAVSPGAMPGTSPMTSPLVSQSPAAK